MRKWVEWFGILIASIFPRRVLLAIHRFPILNDKESVTVLFLSLFRVSRKRLKQCQSLQDFIATSKGYYSLYIQYSWRVVQDEIRKPTKNMMRMVDFQFSGSNYIEMIRKTGQIQGWGAVVSIIDIELVDRTKISLNREKSSYFENNFPIFLLSGNSSTSFFKVCDVLH